MSATYHVILTGGVGSRLWPLSRKSQPKNKDNRNLSIKSLEKLQIEEYFEIVEATPRNTAPAIAFSALRRQIISLKQMKIMIKRFQKLLT